MDETRRMVPADVCLGKKKKVAMDRHEEEAPFGARIPPRGPRISKMFGEGFLRDLYRRASADGRRLMHPTCVACSCSRRTLAEEGGKLSCARSDKAGIARRRGLHDRPRGRGLDT